MAFGKFVRVSEAFMTFSNVATTRRQADRKGTEAPRTFAAFEQPELFVQIYELEAVEPSRTVILRNNPRYIDQAGKAAASSGVRQAPVSDLHKSLSYLNTAGLTGLVEARMDLSGDGAGIINPRLAVQRLLESAAQTGVTVRFDVAVRSLHERADGKIEIALNGGETLLADKVITASGVWNDRFIGAATPASLDTKAKVLKGFWFKDSTDTYDAATNSLTPRTDAEVLTDIRRRITPETCLVFINSPRNPDGKIHRREFLAGMPALLDEHLILRLVSDMIYKEVAPGEENVLTLYGLATPAQRRRIYEVDGTSKSVAKTMDRAAWLLTAAVNVAEIAAVSHLTRGRPVLPQMLQLVSMAEYLTGSAPNYLPQNAALYAGKLRYGGECAQQVASLHASPHRGAYYGYLDFRAVDFGLPMTPLEKENAVVDALTVKGIGVFTGSTFRHTGTIRFNASFGNDALREMMETIVDTFEELGAAVTRREVPLPMIDQPAYDFHPYPVGILTTRKPSVLPAVPRGWCMTIPARGCGIPTPTWPARSRW